MRPTKANLVALAKSKGLTVEFHKAHIEVKNLDGEVVVFGLNILDAIVGIH